MDDIDALIQAVAKRHRVILSKDDPILMLHTYLDFFQEKLAERQEEERLKLVAALELEQFKWSEESRARAERIVNASLNGARKNAAEVCEQAVTGFIRRVEQVVDGKIGVVEQKQIAVYRLAILNLVGAGLVAVGGLFVWLAQ